MMTTSARHSRPLSVIPGHDRESIPLPVIPGHDRESMHSWIPDQVGDDGLSRWRSPNLAS